VLNLADQGGNDDHYSDYWRKRNLIPGASGSTVPLFLTQGLTENNTVADGTAQYLANHGGYERAWLGPWEHVRGNVTDASGRLKLGRCRPRKRHNPARHRRPALAPAGSVATPPEPRRRPWPLVRAAAAVPGGSRSRPRHPCLPRGCRARLGDR
jgi:predicted acyl esterase